MIFKRSKTTNATKATKATRPPGPKAPLRKALELALGVVATVVVGYLASVILFPGPSGGSTRDVPFVIGMSLGEAARELSRQGFTDSVDTRSAHPTTPVGSVIWQDPMPGTGSPRGSAVTLVLSSGPPMVAVPDVHGFDPDMAQKLLLAAGLHVDAVDSIDMKSLPSGYAAGTTPDGGQRLTSGRSVTLHLAR